MDEMIMANLLRSAFRLNLINFKTLDENIDKLQLRLLRRN
jgi:hypothetical protein